MPAIGANITADFPYVRWLGDRHAIEAKMKTWNKMVEDREGELFEWVKELKKVRERRIMVLASANNHYARYGPGTFALFRCLLGDTGLPAPVAEQPSLFNP